MAKCAVCVFHAFGYTHRKRLSFSWKTHVAHLAMQLQKEIKTIDAVFAALGTVIFEHVVFNDSSVTIYFGMRNQDVHMPAIWKIFLGRPQTINFVVSLPHEVQIHKSGHACL